MPALFTDAYSTTSSISAAIFGQLHMARRLERAVCRILRRHAILGDPFDETAARLGTMREELRVIELLGELPRDLAQLAEAKRMIRAAILTDEPERYPRLQSEGPRRG
jgi:cobalamin biosynthesis protein CbiG